MTYYKELPPVKSHEPSVVGLVGSRNKSNSLYLNLQKTRGHQTRQSADLIERLLS